MVIGYITHVSSSDNRDGCIIKFKTDTLLNFKSMVSFVEDDKTYKFKVNKIETNEFGEIGEFVVEAQFVPERFEKYNNDIRMWIGNHLKLEDKPYEFNGNC